MLTDIKGFTFFFVFGVISILENVKMRLVGRTGEDIYKMCPGFFR